MVEEDSNKKASNEISEEKHMHVQFVNKKLA